MAEPLTSQNGCWCYTVPMRAGGCQPTPQLWMFWVTIFAPMLFILKKHFLLPADRHTLMLVEIRWATAIEMTSLTPSAFEITSTSHFTSHQYETCISPFPLTTEHPQNPNVMNGRLMCIHADNLCFSNKHQNLTCILLIKQKTGGIKFFQIENYCSIRKQ